MPAFAQEQPYTIDDIYALPDGEHAELIDGQIFYMAPPNRLHQEISFALSRKIADYIDEKHGSCSCKVYVAPFAVFLNADDRTYVEPDISVICDKDKLTENGCSGAPDWIIEIISPSNPERDYIQKLSLYKAACVREYWIVDPQENRVVVYNLEQDRFQMKAYTFQDQIRSNIFSGLCIDFTSFHL
ncbi:MAG: Uma2 family endonuclease [Eubacterium sp.]|nr:Uma2 family endonuclease [Eubacterium sp.]